MRATPNPTARKSAANDRRGDFPVAQRFIRSFQSQRYTTNGEAETKTKPFCPGQEASKSRFPRFINPPDEEDWIFVKKQRITIVIPPMPNKKNSTVPTLGEAQLQEKSNNYQPLSITPKVNFQLQCPSVISASKQPVEEPEKSLPSPEPAIQPPIAVHPSEPDPNVQKASSMSHRTGSDNYPRHSQREGDGIGACSTTKGRKRMKIFADGSVFLNQRMRASYLEKKLKKTGGLENWLVSLGLSRFVKIFQVRSVNKFQLANLTMQKLKDMGTDAVGPRRKLIHAVDCLCEPHCFRVGI